MVRRRGGRMALGAILAIACLAEAPPDKDVVLRAMRDEIARGKQLRVVGEPPYFIEYSLDDSELFSVGASYGSVLQESLHHLRTPHVRIRVGDAKLDNSNHIYTDMHRGTRYDTSQFSIDDNYNALRLGFWLATDRLYKQALEALARKKASLKNINATDSLPDLGSVPPASVFIPNPRVPTDAAMWRSRVKEVSSVFGAYPQILYSEAMVSVTQSTAYLVNNEGSEFRVPDNLVAFSIRAMGLAKDGMVVRDFAQFLALNPTALPAHELMKAAAKQVGDDIDLLSNATQLDSYSGPMLFEGVAAPQLLAQLLSRNLTIMRRPVSDPDRPINMPPAELEGRLGSRIMPEWMDAVDDPTQKDWRGTQLVGHYPVDTEGVAPKPLQLVEKGILKTFYSTRQPVQGATASNGHARLPGAMGNNTALAGNLFVRCSQPAASADLKKRFLDMVKQRNLAFGIIVRKLDFPSTATLDELRRFGGQQQQRPVSRPIMVYKVTPDGKEELIRGVRFRGLSARSLKDIVAASDESTVFQYMENQAPFAHMDGGGYVAGTSIIAPSLLLDDIELEKIPGELPKPPLVPLPTLTK